MTKHIYSNDQVKLLVRGHDDQALSYSYFDRPLCTRFFSVLHMHSNLNDSHNAKLHDSGILQ